MRWSAPSITPLNKLPVAITPAETKFFSSLAGGGIDICFFTPCSTLPGNLPGNGFQILTPQLYSGPESAPTIQPGVYAARFSQVFVNQDAGTTIQPNINVTVSAAVPEPASSLLIVAGLMAIIFAWSKHA